jgi:hypothetical protein
MDKPDILIVDGPAYSWQRLRELRRHQREAWRLSQLQQLMLFAVKDDSRPATEQTAAGRYQKSSLFTASPRNG